MYIKRSNQVKTQTRQTLIIQTVRSIVRNEKAVHQGIKLIINVIEIKNLEIEVVLQKIQSTVRGPSREIEMIKNQVLDL